MTASFLRASLFTSVVAFGVAAFAFGVGLVLILIGVALLRIHRRLEVVRRRCHDGSASSERRASALRSRSLSLTVG